MLNISNENKVSKWVFKTFITARKIVKIENLGNPR